MGPVGPESRAGEGKWRRSITFIILFPKLSDAEAKHLAGMATICDFKDGELVFQVGRRGLPLYVVESGAIAAGDESGYEPVTLAVHGPREFTGGAPC